MFGQHNNNYDHAGAPAVPPVGTLTTSTGIPDDQAVTQMLSDTNAPSNSFVPFSSEALSPEPVQTIPSGPPPAPVSAPIVPAPAPSNASNMMDMSAEDLVRMKQEALQHLQPLVGSLQQNPEEEFRTLMMMIQATDDKSMLKKALDAAKKIGDDKVRAQAMLDVINEINYFTQMSGDQA